MRYGSYTPASERDSALIRYIFEHLDKAPHPRDCIDDYIFLDELIKFFNIPVITEAKLGNIILGGMHDEGALRLRLISTADSEESKLHIRVAMSFCCRSGYGDIKFHFYLPVTFSENGRFTINQKYEGFTIDSPPACLFTCCSNPYRYGDMRYLKEVIESCVEEDLAKWCDIARQCVYCNINDIFDELVQLKSRGKGVLLNKALLVKSGQLSEPQ
ncbi:hypothetical protein KRX19_07705 [Cardiobacteriaceae bacterium TAE3-ERU3]|nr:hypothetical protein [Cardiobacteriaceae bacterium TAE3-ERU3]